MSQPTPYTRIAAFADDESSAVGGRSTVRTAGLDGELDNVATTVSEILTNLEINQRDDGEIRDGRVKLHTLASDVRALFAAGAANPRGDWLTATDYALGDLVSQSTNTYLCATDHTSGTFSTDLAADKWLLIALGSAVAASAVSFAPTATIAATNVQSAIEEADSEGRALAAAASASAADVLTRLADAVDHVEGAALVGFSPALVYTNPERVGYQLPWATFRGTGGNDTTALQALLSAGYNVQLVGTIYANNLTATTAGQHLKGVGRARVVKNANGPLVTFSAADQCTEGIEWRGDAATPVYTGANVVSTGDNFLWLHSGSRWAHGTALVLQGANPLVHSQMDIIQSSLLGSSYDIDCGLDGTARLYGRIFGVYTSQNTGGIRLTDVGSWSIAQSQFGALTVQSGGSGYLAGCNGGNYIANRINGNISVGISSALFAANLVGGSTVVFESGTSGHSFDDSNSCASGTTITDSSNASNVVDMRLIAPASWTPTITGTGVSIGDAVCTGQVVKCGRICTATFRIAMGATTNFGSGTWSLSLPYIPATTLSYWGVARALDFAATYYTGAINTSTSGVAEALITGDGAVGQFNNARPFTWGSGDVLEGSITYVTAT